MHIDFLGSGPLSYVLPIGAALAGIFAIGQLISSGRFAPALSMIVAAGLLLLGFNLMANHLDSDALKRQVSDRYGLTLTDAQVGQLRENHSYRRYAPDVTIASDRGVATPYGSADVSLRGERQSVMMYLARGRWYIGDVPVKAGQKVSELPVSSSIPNLN